MKPFSRAAIALALLLAPVLLVVGPVGETDPPASKPDASKETAERIRAAWIEVHELQRSGEDAEARRRQREFGDEFFASYLSAPETTPGQQALATAFRMWGRAGDTEAIENAMARVDRGSEHWVQLIQLARPAFAAEDRLGDFREVVAELAAEMTDPEVASEVWITLGRDYRSSTELERAVDCFRQAVDLDAHPRLVDAARTALRELDRLAPGRSAPGFTAVDLQGRRISLRDLEGRFVLLQFWSSECETCMPRIDQLRFARVDYPAEKLAYVGVTLDSSADAARKVVEIRRMDWPQIFSPEGPDGPVPRLYEVRDVPRSFLIDPEGVIVARDVSGEELDLLLVELLPVTQGAAPEASNAR